MNSSLKRKINSPKHDSTYIVMFWGREKIKSLNICIEPDFINPGFLSIRKKNWLGKYNKKEGPGSIIIVSSCTVVQK